MSAECDATSEDLELLETYLDGELDAAQTAALTQRLSVEPALAATLAELRSQRQLRMAVWKALEPDTKTTQQLIWRVRGAAAERRHETAGQTRSAAGSVRWDVWAVTRWTAAAAACAVIGFAIGRVGRVGQNHNVSESNLSVANGTVPTPGPGYVLPGQPGTAVGFPFQNAPDAGRYNDDFARDANFSGAPSTSVDDRVKLTSDDKDVQKF